MSSMSVTPRCADHGKLVRMLATPDRDSVLADLRAVLGESGLRMPGESDPALQDYRRVYRGRALAIAMPRDTAQVSALLALCHARRIPVVPQGGNTGYSGGATPDDSGTQLLVSLHRLDRIRAVDADNFTLTAEAGCTLQSVQDAAATAGRYFPLSLGSQESCQIGGNLATNAGGIHVLRFGMMRDLALGVEAVLPDGSVYAGLKTLRKDNTGYDLRGLLIGSEGTLAILTAATLKLWPAQRACATAAVALDDTRAAISLLSLLRAQAGERLIAFELVPAETLAILHRELPQLRQPFAPPPPVMVLCELASAADEPLDATLAAALERASAIGLVRDAVLTRSARERAELWHLRESISEAQRRGVASLKHDVSLPPASIPDFIARVTAWCTVQQPDAELVCYGHVGDGNLHCNVNARPGADRAAFLAREAAVRDAIHGLVREFHGSISAEHGIGQSKVDELPRYASAVKLATMRQLKAAIDPHGIMNPGKLMRMPEVSSGSAPNPR
jgi:FAD/FMN-containing dehydrogenase